MRVDATTFTLMSDLISVHDTASRRDDYRHGRFLRSNRVTDLEKRYRWDLFWLAFSTSVELRERVQPFNDVHLDTALRRIVQPLEVQS